MNQITQATGQRMYLRGYLMTMVRNKVRYSMLCPFAFRPRSFPFVLDWDDVHCTKMTLMDCGAFWVGGIVGSKEHIVQFRDIGYGD